MDGGDAPTGGRDDEPGVLGRLPATRPQHRSGRRDRKIDAPTRPTARAPRRRSGAPTTPVDAAPTTPPAPAAPPPAPAVPAPPAAPRSGWATPDPAPPQTSPLPPLPALVDGGLRLVEQVVRGAVRRLPFR